ncbi:MAG: hypothetical protein ABIF19_03965, partial [Planctomycetota bacterium]
EKAGEEIARIIRSVLLAVSACNLLCGCGQSTRTVELGAGTEKAAERAEDRTIRSPIFADPHYHGSCDPETVWNDHEEEWWIFYTARRGNDYHMFVTFKDNANPPWGGPGSIVHYKAPRENLLNGWQKVNARGLSAVDVIDATLIRVGDEFRMYYRVGKGGGIHWAVSRDAS